ncbi:hypothetical protein [Francisella sp. SYW-9]|uniref:hypothetical protein n=1 Tax=Francisella sp. SYW-9 TaxID=2610888 RepID=UPI00123C882E|nr:hypothetical protein [Francisella sp. SYW-9]
MDLKEFKKIELSHFKDTKSVEYLKDEVNRLLFLDSPALAVFRDFEAHKALVVRGDTHIKDVKAKLIDNHLDYALVTSSSDKVTGTISLHYIEGQGLQERARDAGVKPAELTADDAKFDISMVNVAPYAIIKEAKIGHILNTLINSTHPHFVVSDKNKDGEKYIRGYFSLPYIRKKLGLLDVFHSYTKEEIARITRFPS